MSPAIIIVDVRCQFLGDDYGNFEATLLSRSYAK